MLELKDITKIYPAGGENVHALKGVSLQFRESEFVSILGPSGCGKTTMLNIIGGLDKYSDGDLVINGKSTKEYKAREWDAYRNHSVGFVFQSYNLIPHQTVLTNVELALTLSGVSKAERRKRAKEALEKVGLKDQMKKRPTEMSGGQMQRVAIARAIVNNPDIILADEPTGALDTETSVQVMDILKEIAKDRLVIMVTHNPELAEKYSTRIVRMLDCVITDDSQPVSNEDYANELEIARKKEIEDHKTKKPSMSLFTAFGLSLKNLFTKKGRTILTSFAGSIGIIGIALIYAVSNGMTEFIDSVQEQTLSSYPITIEATTVDMSSMLNTFMGKAESTLDHPSDGVYQKNMMYELMNSLNSLESRDNDLVSFKKFIDDERSKEDSKLNAALSGVQYAYNTNLNIYTKNVDGEIILSDATQLMMDLIRQYMGIDMELMMSINQGSALGQRSSQMMTQNIALWKEMVAGTNGEPVNDVVKEQYDLLYGRWPENYNELILFVDEHDELNDLTLYALGLKHKDEIEKNTQAVVNHENIVYEENKWSYEELCDLEFRTVLPSDCYEYDEKTGLFRDLRETSMGMKMVYDKGLTLKVCGIAKPSARAIGIQENGHIGYTSLLTDYIISYAKESPVIKAQLASKDKDVLTGLAFKESVNLNEKEKGRNDALNLMKYDYREIVKLNIDKMIETDYLCTMLCFIPVNQEKHFKETYFKLCDGMVLPGSAQRIDQKQDDKVCLYRVVVMKHVKDTFKQQLQNNLRCQCREYNINEINLKPKEEEEINNLSKKVKELKTTLIRNSLAGYSEVYYALLHLKYLRLYVESNLKYGNGDYFTCIVFCNVGKEQKIVSTMIKKFTDSNEEGWYGTKEELKESEDFYPFILIKLGVPSNI